MDGREASPSPAVSAAEADLAPAREPKQLARRQSVATPKVERRDFLVELGTEELPPKALHELEQAFAAGVRKGLTEAGLAHGDVLSFATPRRLAVWVKRLASRQPEQNV